MPTYSGTTGSDVLNGSSGDDIFYAKAGADTINAKGGDDTIFGAGGKDTISGGSGGDLIFGGSGNDNIDGGSGNDEIWGGAGNDKIYTGDGADDLYFGANHGNDQVFGSNFTIHLTGGITEDDVSVALSTSVNVGADGLANTFDDDYMFLTIDTGEGTITLTGLFSYFYGDDINAFNAIEFE